MPITFKVFTQWILLSGWMFIATQVLAESASSQEDFIAKSLTTAGGMQVLFAESHVTPLVSLQIGVKNIPPPSGRLAYPSAPLLILLETILQWQVGQHTLVERTHLPTQENITVEFQLNRQAPLDFTIRLTSTPEQLETTLSQLVESLQLNLSAEEFKRIQDFYIRMSINSIEGAWDGKQLAKEAFALSLEQSGAFVHPVVGWTQRVQRLRLTDLKTWVAQHFTQKNLIITAAGAIQADRLLKAIDANLGKLPQQSSQVAMSSRPPPVAEKAKKIYIFKDIPNSAICFGHPWISPSHPDYSSGYLLGELFSHLIVNFLREAGFDEELYEDGRWSLFPGGPRVGGCILLPDHTQTPQFLAAVKQFFQSLKTEGLSHKRLCDLEKSIEQAGKIRRVAEDVRFFVCANTDTLRASPMTTAYYLLQEKIKLIELEDRVKRPHLLGRPRKAFRDFSPSYYYEDCLSQIKQHLAEMNRILKTHVDPDKLSFVEVGLFNHLQNAGRS
jgi:Peptidase M16 inactive domain